MDIQRAIEYFEEKKHWESMAVLSPILEGKKSEKVKYMETAIYAMQELQQYRQIGTIEQCREARQKQEPKKYKLINSVRCCPECDSPIKACYDFCKSCGQALKFTE